MTTTDQFPPLDERRTRLEQRRNALRAEAYEAWITRQIFSVQSTTNAAEAEGMKRRVADLQETERNAKAAAAKLQEFLDALPAEELATSVE